MHRDKKVSLSILAAAALLIALALGARALLAQDTPEDPNQDIPISALEEHNLIRDLTLTRNFHSDPQASKLEILAPQASDAVKPGAGDETKLLKSDWIKDLDQPPAEQTP